MSAARLDTMPLEPPVSGWKRPIDAIPSSRRLRSNLPRRRRIPLLPTVNNAFPSILSGCSDDEAEESSSSCLYSELSVESSLASRAPRRTRAASSQALRASKGIGGASGKLAGSREMGEKAPVISESSCMGSACSERLSSGGGIFSSYSWFESELFNRSSGDYCFSDYSYSFPPDSGNKFSQRSRDGKQCETLFLAVSLMDRFLSRGCFMSARNLQLLGIACATLAARIEENRPYNCICQKSFTVGPNEYGRSDVVAMEWLVLEVLDFHCFLPTSHSFLWFYLKAAGADAEVEKLARYLAVLSLLDHVQLSFWSSTVAAGLVILASLATNRDSSCRIVMEAHLRTKNDDLPECIQGLDLEWLVKYAG